MNQDALAGLLNRLARGEVTVDHVVDRLKRLPFEDLGFACIDHHRPLRKGLSEVIYGQGKEASVIIRIMKQMISQGENILVTRLSLEKAKEIQRYFPETTFYEQARMITLIREPIRISGRGTILVMSAGTSDIPVAEEAAVAARFMGNQVDTVYDVGVAGLHRLLGYWDRIDRASVIVVVAGMEGALPSVVGGLVDKPVIAVPTSVGYGASFNGIAALLGMLNSCAAGVTVVNIDNGFGAGYAAGLINRGEA